MAYVSTDVDLRCQQRSQLLSTALQNAMMLAVAHLLVQDLIWSIDVPGGRSSAQLIKAFTQLRVMIADAFYCIADGLHFGQTVGSLTSSLTCGFVSVLSPHTEYIASIELHFNVINYNPNE